MPDLLVAGMLGHQVCVREWDSRATEKLQIQWKIAQQVLVLKSPGQVARVC